MVLCKLLKVYIAIQVFFYMDRAWNLTITLFIVSVLKVELFFHYFVLIVENMAMRFSSSVL
jgi:hypothetical protein